MDLSTHLDNSLLDKIKSSLNIEQQELFIQNFYGFLNYHQENDFIINLDNVYKWIGYNQKFDCKKVLKKYFKENIDYKIYKVSSNNLGDIKDETTKIVAYIKNGGQNKETILLNIKTFKKLCMKANTKKADQIHDYYITMENIMQEHIKEQLKQKEQILIEQQQKSLFDKEQLLINAFHKKPVVYGGEVDENLEKFGYSDDIKQRVDDHKRNFETFKLDFVIECEQNIELEKKIKTHNDISNRRVSKIFNGKNQTELIRLDDYLQKDDLIKIINTLKMTIIVDKEIIEMKHKEKIKEEETKQLELQMEIQKETTKQKSIELEMRKLELQFNKKEEILLNDVNEKKDKTKEQDKNIYNNFITTKTVYSDNYKDSIAMNELYNEFKEYIKKIYKEYPIPGQKTFSKNIKLIGINCKKIRINDKKISGITNRKFI